MRNINVKSFDKMRFILNSIYSKIVFCFTDFRDDALRIEKKIQAMRGGRSKPNGQPSEKAEDTSRINSRADFGGGIFSRGEAGTI